MMEGYGGIGFKRLMFNNATFPWGAYLRQALADPACLRSDDLVVSNYLTRVGFKGMYLNLRVNQLRTGFHEDALHRLEPAGHPYPRCMRHLRDCGIASTMRLRSEPPVAAPVAAPPPLAAPTSTVSTQAPPSPPVPLDDAPPNGSLIRGHGRQVYLLEDGHKRPVSDMATFARHGWSLEDVRVRDQRWVAALPTGPPVE